MTRRCIVTLIDPEDDNKPYERIFQVDTQELTESGLKLFNREAQSEMFITHELWRKLEFGDYVAAKAESTINFNVYIDGRQPLLATKVSIHDKTGALSIVLGKETINSTSGSLEVKYVKIFAKGTFSFVKTVKAS